MKKLLSPMLLIVLTVSWLCAAVPAWAIQPQEYCIKYTPQMVEDTYRYLDEFYTKKHPEEALLWTYGLPEDKRIMTEHTNAVTKGCITDREKVKAIFGWITQNIEYDEERSSTYSFDVLYDGVGNCIGQAMLLRDMCRVAGIPAVWGEGYRYNMANFTVEKAQDPFTVGHAWCYVYLDGQWMLYDPVWGVDGTTNKEDIAKDYFTDAVEGITPLYHDTLPPFRSADGCFVYRDGRLYIYSQNGPEPEDSSLGGHGFMVNTQLFLNAKRNRGETDGFNYMDDISKKDHLVIGELYHDGWFGYGYGLEIDGQITYDMPQTIHYAYKNGILAASTVMEFNGQNYYMYQGSGYKLCADINDVRVHAGHLFVETGYKGKIYEFCNFDKLKNDPTIEIKWTAHDPDVATMDDNFVITSYKEGSATFEYEIHFTRIVELEPEVLARPDIMEQIKQECLMNGDELVDGKIISRGVSGFGYISYYFMDDITRPETFGEQNGGADNTTAPPSDQESNPPSIAESATPSVEINTDILSKENEQNIINTLKHGETALLQASSGCNALSFSVELMNRVAALNCDMEAIFDNVAVEFNGAALNSMFEAELSGEVTLECLDIDQSALSADQRGGLPDRGVERVLRIGMRNGENHFRSFGDGEVTVLMPFEADGYNQEDYKAYHIDKDGVLEELETYILDGVLYFKTNHFSDFVIINTAAQTGFAWWIAVATVVVIAVAVTVILMIRRKRTRDEQ